MADEAAYDAVLFNLQVIGEAVKQFSAEPRARLPEAHRTGPARLRDLIAHHDFAVDPEIIWDAATHHVPALLVACRQLQREADADGPRAARSRFSASSRRRISSSGVAGLTSAQP